MIVREYSLAASYRPTTCVVRNISYASDLPCTYCAAGTKGRRKEKGGCQQTEFPCVEVWVKYVLGGREIKGKLHPDSLQATGASKQCSYHVCKKDYQENKQAVQKYANQWHAQGKNSFDCFYDTNHHGSVIASKRHSKTHVINSMVWPSIIILICGVIFLHLETKRRGMPFCGEKVTATSIRGHHFEHRNGRQQLHQHKYIEAKYSNDSNHRVKSSLTKDRPAHSMSSIQKPMSTGLRIVIEDENSQVTRSVSADGFNEWCLDDNKKKTKLGERQDSTRSADGSIGAHVTGIETPV
ncbi:hypothetical protein CAPTEDRAFT_222265 [Capitella teleta]|uniref:Uncharacterized protein n=1 Tax=Capitella teleta TaxID=283909 RepID=R7VHW8_CAPTE|nr:hypothetical protein CAPTEDRAFT_222265 [Capitella teleta]|eukprot:ELU15901.1 hypothetical protein CAPTEDRAFT_222265 [Capitella teleta]